MKEQNASGTLDERLAGYSNTAAASEWLDRNWERVKELFLNVRLRDFVFEPIKGVFSLDGNDSDAAIRQCITMVAVANAVMAGLPGKMGIGVVVSIALEGWMAWVIANRVGLKIEKVGDVWKYFGLFAAVGGTILIGFRALLGVAFSAFSIIPGANPLIFAELLVTNLVGVVFWIGFLEAREKGSFAVPIRALSRIGSETKSLASFQWRAIRDHLNPSALREMGKRLRAWLSGDIPHDKAQMRGDVATAVLMAYLIERRFDELEGPLGRQFIAAIRDRFPELGSASLDVLATHFGSYDAEQMAGVLSLVKGKLFERLVAHYENGDDDHWRATLHSDESFPGSDITLTHDVTGETIEISLKATNSASYIENALLRYPETPILTTEEVARFFEGDDRVTASSISNEQLTQVTENNFDSLLNSLGRADIAQSAAAGVAIGATIGLWPFVVAYLKGRISQDQLEKACVKVLGEAGVALSSRLAYAVLLGPLFAWYLLARGVASVTKQASPKPINSLRRLVAS